MTEATIAWELCNWRQWLSCEEGQEEGNWRFEPTHVGRGAGVAGRRPGLEQLPAQPAIDLRQHLTTTTTTPPSLAQEARSGPNFLIFTLSSQPPGSLAKDYPSPPLSLALGLQPMSPSYRTSRGYVRLVLAFSLSIFSHWIFQGCGVAFTQCRKMGRLGWCGVLLVYEMLQKSSASLECPLKSRL